MRIACFRQFAALLALALLPFAARATALPKPSVGTLERIELRSAFVDQRPVEVWLPEGYAEQAKAGQRFQVLYMHDGQMLFDAGTTWNKQAWHVDVALDRLMREGKVPPTIVVAVWNNGKYRAAEYMPQKFLERMPAAPREQLVKERLKGRPQADNYLRFLVEELKPLIDRRYATRSEAAATFIMGSSMGGLISVYAFNEYPQVFGGAAGLSTHWVGIFQPNASIPLAAFNYLQDKLPAPATRRLYLDRGTEQLEALYGPAQAFVDQIVRERGYTEAHYLSRVFEGTDHSEKAWSERLAVPLQFLLGKR